MTNKEILEKLPVGGIVPKRVLAAMKKKGLVFGYSPWGYLESARIPYRDKDDSWHEYVEVFPNGNAREADSFQGTSEELRNKFVRGCLEYLGFSFAEKYLDGCFRPYLIKTGPENGGKVNHTMSLHGCII